MSTKKELKVINKSAVSQRQLNENNTSAAVAKQRTENKTTTNNSKNKVQSTVSVNNNVKNPPTKLHRTQVSANWSSLSISIRPQNTLSPTTKIGKLLFNIIFCCIKTKY